MTEKKFNIIFNAFILIGMIVAVVWVNVYKLQEPDVQVVKQIVVAVGAVMGVVNTVLTANGSIWTFLFGIVDVLICQLRQREYRPVPGASALLPAYAVRRAMAVA